MKNIFNINILAFALGLGAGFPARATGGMSSGGGELIGDATNPWFANATRPATYCIEVDEAHFGLSRERVTTLVTEAFDYWRQELALARTIPQTEHRIVLSVLPPSFSFQLTCSETVDLRFQFGILATDQGSYLEDPTRFVAAAVRTSYDPIQLAGRGFVYVSPESGPLALSGVALAERPWSGSDGKLLRLILLHELGHVIGIPHHGQRYDLMSAEFPELAVQARSGAAAVMPRDPAVFRFHALTSAPACRGDGLPRRSPLFRLLGLPTDLPCERLTVSETQLIFEAGDHSYREWREVGRITFGDSSSERSDPLVHLRLSPAQAVFPPLPDFVNYLSGPEIVHQKRQAPFRDAETGELGTIFVELSPGCYSVNAFAGGRAYLDLSNNCGR